VTRDILIRAPEDAIESFKSSSALHDIVRRIALGLGELKFDITDEARQRLCIIASAMVVVLDEQLKLKKSLSSHELEQDANLLAFSMKWRDDHLKK
jgi:hypothetical protein